MMAVDLYKKTLIKGKVICDYFKLKKHFDLDRCIQEYFSVARVKHPLSQSPRHICCTCRAFQNRIQTFPLRITTADFIKQPNIL